MAENGGEGGKKAAPTLYRDNEVDGFRMGALFDLRVRFAFEMLTHGDLSSLMWGLAELPGAPQMEVAKARGRMAAAACLAAMTELVDQAEKAGLVQPFPEGGDLSTTMKRHAPRLARWQAEQYVAQQREQQAMAGRIATPPGVSSAPILPGGALVGPDGKPTN